VAEREYFVLLYDLVNDYLERRQPLRPEHLELATRGHEAGELLMAGAFEGPVDGAALVFTSRQAAERFAGDDPYVREGIVTEWRVRKWNVVVGGTS
jgi:uncharacterized protein YciI